MGSANTSLLQVGGTSAPVDVRLNRGPLPGGLTMIINSDRGVYAGYRFSTIFGIGHNFGRGPFFGLGTDALRNYLLVGSLAPFAGILDADGSARIDIEPGVLSGLMTDNIVVLQDPNGRVVGVHGILEFDG